MKPWYLSKTFWIQALTITAGIIGIVTASEVVANHPQLILVLTTLVLPIINLFIRWLTDQPITSVFREMDALRNVKANHKKRT